MRRCLVFAVLLLFAGLLTQRPLCGEEKPLVRFAFGSCCKQDKPTPIWEAIIEQHPEFFVFLGDNIYGDTEDMEVLRAKYAQLGAQPGYQKLTALCPIYATWDDHDFGVNDGGADYPRKRESQQVFLDFFRAPPDDVRRQRAGVYSSHVWGPPGRRVQLILLDFRYFRSPLRTGFQPGEPGDGYRGKYLPNTDPQATVLGEEQWRWLAEQLRVPAELRFIGTGVQVVTCEHGSEMWANFPHERERLLRTIREAQAQGVIFLTGDRHLAEIARLPADDPLSVGYPLFDVTSSSLNTPSGNLTKAGIRFANEINRYRVGLTYFDTNFGQVEIDWERPDPEVRVQVRDERGGVVLQQRVTVGQLRAGRHATR